MAMEHDFSQKLVQELQQRSEDWVFRLNEDLNALKSRSMDLLDSFGKGVSERLQTGVIDVVESQQSILDAFRNEIAREIGQAKVEERAREKAWRNEWQEALGRIRQVTTQREVLEKMLDASAMISQGVLLFIVKRGAVTGWEGKGYDEVFLEDFKMYAAILEEDFLFKNADEMKATLVFSQADIPEDEQPMDILGLEKPSRILLAPLCLFDSAAAFIYLDGDKLALSEDEALSEIEALLSLTSLWLENLAMRKSLGLPVQLPTGPDVAPPKPVEPPPPVAPPVETPFASAVEIPAAPPSEPRYFPLDEAPVAPPPSPVEQPEPVFPEPPSPAVDTEVEEAVEEVVAEVEEAIEEAEVEAEVEEAGVEALPAEPEPYFEEAPVVEEVEEEVEAEVAEEVVLLPPVEETVEEEVIEEEVVSEEEPVIAAPPEPVKAPIYSAAQRMETAWDIPITPPPPEFRALEEPLAPPPPQPEPPRFSYDLKPEPVLVFEPVTEPEEEDLFAEAEEITKKQTAPPPVFPQALEEEEIVLTEETVPAPVEEDYVEPVSFEETLAAVGEAEEVSELPTSQLQMQAPVPTLDEYETYAPPAEEEPQREEAEAFVLEEKPLEEILLEESVEAANFEPPRFIPPPPPPPEPVRPAAPPAAPAGTLWSSPEEERLHVDAKRFARLLVSEIKLYNEESVAEGRIEKDLYRRLKRDIDRSREMYDKRVSSQVSSKIDYFHEELTRILGESDVLRMGPDYPGPQITS